MELFCANIKRDPFSLLRFPFLSNIRFFSCATYPFYRLKYRYCCFSDHLFLNFIIIYSLRLYYYLFLESFSHQCYLVISYWSLSDSKSPQFSKTLLSILADLNNAAVWTVSTRSVISKSYIPCTYPLFTVPRAPFTFGIIVSFIFHMF